MMARAARPSSVKDWSFFNKDEPDNIQLQKKKRGEGSESESSEPKMEGWVKDEIREKQTSASPAEISVSTEQQALLVDSTRNKDEARLEARREKKRLNASMARKRSRDHVSELHQRVYKMAKDVDNLKVSNAQLLEKIKVLTEANDALARSQQDLVVVSSPRGAGERELIHPLQVSNLQDFNFSKQNPLAVPQHVHSTMNNYAVGGSQLMCAHPYQEEHFLLSNQQDAHPQLGNSSTSSGGLVELRHHLQQLLELQEREKRSQQLQMLLQPQINLQKDAHTRFDSTLSRAAQNEGTE